MEERKTRNRVKTWNKVTQKGLHDSRLIDDAISRTVFKNHKECVTEILRVLMHDPNLELDSINTQDDLSFPTGRGICMDVFAIDSSKPHLYNVEIQRVADKSLFQRAYYYNAAVHVAYTPSGTAWKELPAVTTIFILEKDWLGLHRVCDSYVWMHEDLKIPGMNSPRIMFFNTEIQSEDEVGRLMADFVNPDPSTMNFPTLAEGVNDVKGGLKGQLTGKDDGGDKTMGNVWFDAIDEQMDIEREEGMQEGKEEAARTIAARLLKRGNDSLDEIADLSGLAIEDVKAIQEEMTKQA